jgi:ketosteroid isomerase-like protein
MMAKIGVALLTAGLVAFASPALASAAQPTHRQASVPPGLARAVHDYNEATVHKDIGKLSELVTDNYMLVNSDASVQDKPSYLADFRVPGFTLDPYQIEDPFYRVHGDTAITGWRFHLTWTQDGKRQARFLRIVHSWVKENGRWRINYTQLTRVPA